MAGTNVQTAAWDESDETVHIEDDIASGQLTWLNNLLEIEDPDGDTLCAINDVAVELTEKGYGAAIGYGAMLHRGR